MVKSIIYIVILLIPGILAAQQKPATTTASKAQPVIKLANQADSSQYILGAYLGQYLRSNGIAITKADLFIKGMDDVLSGKELLVNADSVPKKMNEFLTGMVIERNRALEKELFDIVRGKPGIGVLPSGVCYAVAKSGTGIRPLLTDSLEMHVKGYLPEGTLFEDTYSGGKPLHTTARSLIPGLKEIIQIMPAGSVWRIYIPSSLAYAEKGVAGRIPPYSALVFDVELLRVVR